MFMGNVDMIAQERSLAKRVLYIWKALFFD